MSQATVSISLTLQRKISWLKNQVQAFRFTKIAPGPGIEKFFKETLNLENMAFTKLGQQVNTYSVFTSCKQETLKSDMYTVMVIIGCERCDRTEASPNIHQNVAPPTQKIALSLRSSTRTSNACQKKEKILKKKRLSRLLTFFLRSQYLGAV